MGYNTSCDQSNYIPILLYRETDFHAKKRLINMIEDHVVIKEVGGTAPQPKLSMFSALSQKYQHLFFFFFFLSDTCIL